MMLPPSVSTTMRVPSLYFRVKNTPAGRCSVRKVESPHGDGVHLRMEMDVRWYTLEELDPISEDDYNEGIARLRKEVLARNRGTVDCFGLQITSTPY